MARAEPEAQNTFFRVVKPFDKFDFAAHPTIQVHFRIRRIGKYQLNPVALLIELACRTCRICT